jgi:hypothetical protein
MKDETMALIEKQTRFYLSTPERAAEALLFVRNLERFAKEVKEKVKARTVEIMDKQQTDMIEYQVVDPDTGEVREWKVTRDYGKQSKEYRPANVIEALGMERALPFLKVGKVSLESYLKKASLKGVLTMEEVGKATADPVMKIIKGSGVKITEVKPTI